MMHLESYELFETPQRVYVVGSTSDSRSHRVLRIDKDTLESQVDAHVYSTSEIAQLMKTLGNSSTRRVQIHGLLGAIYFLRGYYLVAITDRRTVARIKDHAIYGIDDTILIPLFDISDGPKTMRAQEKRYRDLFISLDLSKDFYFSHTYPLCTDNMFAWNAHLARPFPEEASSMFLVQVVHGYVASQIIQISSHRVELILIARRSRHFAGTRYLKRGANEDGYAANEVEVEQIMVERDTGVVCGYKQLRGSIPLYWGHDVGGNKMVKPKPDIVVGPQDGKWEVTKRHFDNLFARYVRDDVNISTPNCDSSVVVPPSPNELIVNPAMGTVRASSSSLSPAGDVSEPSLPKKPRIFCLSLLKKFEKKKREMVVGDLYRRAINHLNTAHYKGGLDLIEWDFRTTSKKDPLTVLNDLSSIAEYCMERTSVDFHNPSRPDSCTRQSGIIRVNCIDCLDRTNIAQFVIGLAVLTHQLQALGITHEYEFSTLLLSMYEDMGDHIAVQYGGSRTVSVGVHRRGVSWDLVSNIQRFYSNNFTDAEKQDAINLFLGNYEPWKHRQEPLWELESDLYLHTHYQEEGHIFLSGRTVKDASTAVKSATPALRFGTGYRDLAEDIDDSALLVFPAERSKIVDHGFIPSEEFCRKTGAMSIESANVDGNRKVHNQNRRHRQHATVPVVSPPNTPFYETYMQLPDKMIDNSTIYAMHCATYESFLPHSTMEVPSAPPVSHTPVPDSSRAVWSKFYSFDWSLDRIETHIRRISDFIDSHVPHTDRQRYRRNQEQKTSQLVKIIQGRFVVRHSFLLRDALALGFSLSFLQTLMATGVLRAFTNEDQVCRFAWDTPVRIIGQYVLESVHDVWHKESNRFFFWLQRVAELKDLDFDHMRGFPGIASPPLTSPASSTASSPFSQVERELDDEETDAEVSEPSDPTIVSAVVVDGHVFTLHDILHGVLRGNARPPGHILRVFGPTDARLKYSLPCDARVHCVLESGSAALCTMEQDVDNITQEYLGRHVQCNISTNIVVLPRVFGPYRHDFGATQDMLMRWLLRWSDHALRAQLLMVMCTGSYSFFVQQSASPSGFVQGAGNPGAAAANASVLSTSPGASTSPLTQKLQF